MDDILFRHTAIATPKDKNEDFLKRQGKSEQDKSLVDDAKKFDSQLKSILKVDVPEDLANKILLEQSFFIESKKNLSHRWHLAIAASIAFIIGISLPLLNSINHSPLDIGTVAMQHIQKEYFFTSNINEQASLVSVNAKLANYGAKATGDLGEVLFVNFCDFEGTPALHMIIKGETGRITVFVVPKKAGFTDTPIFNNQYLKGVSKDFVKTNLLIIGEKDEPLEKIQQTLQQNLQWEI